MVWWLYFDCPLCRSRTEIAIHGGLAAAPVWQSTPSPEEMCGIVGDVKEVRDGLWDRLTLAPSLQDLPHPRQIKCTAHFSVVAGTIHPS